MEPNSSDSQPESVKSSDDTSTDPQDTTEESLVFGRSEYAKKDFWNERFKS